MNIQQQFEFLTHSLRLQLEQIVRFPSLFDKDEKEAIYNVEIVVKSVLDAFHNIYDAVQKLSNNQINLYSEPELHFILSIRNAKHHNKTISSLLLQSNNVLFVDYLPYEGSFPCIIYPVSWNDVLNYILEDKKGSKKVPELKCYLQSDKFEEFADKKRYSIDLIYLNIIPLMLRAGKKLVSLCFKYIPNKLYSTEARFFLDHFNSISDEYKLEYKLDYNILEYKKDIQKINDFSDYVYKKLSIENLYWNDIKPRE